MKKFNRVCAMLLVLALALTMVPAVFAANSETAVIDTSKKGSLELFKYDMTSAQEDGFVPGTYVSDGKKNAEAEAALADYAIKGVIFSYEKVADIETDSVIRDGVNTTVVLYAFDEDSTVLEALELTAADAYKAEGGKLFFESNVLNDALAAGLTANETDLKDALEACVADSAEMPETDENGHSKVSNLPLGLYLLVETYVPEDVMQTTAPFFVSLPMTTIDGIDWMYDVVVYPKNLTDMPTLEKTLRETKDDTGKNGGTNAIDDGYAHTATGSDADVVDYQIISHLPRITSKASNLTTYTFVDTLSAGLEYNKDAIIEWYADEDCTDLITTWAADSGKFTATYGTADNNATTMTIAMTAAGLAEINLGEAKADGADALERGYSHCYLRIVYSCTVNSSSDVVYGDNGNPNEVELTWKRTNTEYFDTLEDCCHFYTYGVDLVKVFSDDAAADAEKFAKVNFVIQNVTDGYWVKAELNEDDGVWYVVDHVETEAEATVFHPVAGGALVIKGLEDDEYEITETQSAPGYTLLKEAIALVITSTEQDDVLCDLCGAKLRTAEASVDGNDVTMSADNGSAHAIADLKVINTPGFKLPDTGDNGTWMMSIGGILVMAMAIAVVVIAKKRNYDVQ